MTYQAVAGLAAAPTERMVGMATNRPLTVLVVEDDLPIRELLADLLRGEGFTVVEVEDGQEAIDAIAQPARAPAFCLVLLDLMLPHVDGLAVLQYLRQKAGASPPVIALSANRVLLRRALETGAMAAVAKPFDVPELLDVIARHCHDVPA
jgi:CheY-like chemotaxis protein